MIASLAALLILQTPTSPVPEDPNTLTAEETKAGWRLLFDGKTTNGWHNFRAEGIRPGWQVKDGALVCADPPNAGDIVTDDKFDWFELTLDFNLSKGGNSGIMFRVADTGLATWHSGPEIQIYDHAPQKGVETSGYLYQLYAPDFDATNPAGEWNHMRILVDPVKCQTDMNGKKYYDYVYGSKDFWARVAKSKFAAYPQFAKSDKGSIAIQGDHGVVSFRNIKLRPIKASAP